MGMWASSYLVGSRGVTPEQAATFAALFYLGITIGRFFSGFLTIKFSDSQMIRGGFAVIALGLVVLLIPAGEYLALAGLLLVGLGTSPIYPCIIHSTPANFGVENSQSITGVQMASAYTGILTMPPLFGLIADYISLSLYPIFVACLLAIMATMYQCMLKKVQ